MTREQFNTAFTTKGCATTVLHCDEKEVNEGIEKLLTYVNNANDIIDSVNKCISDFKGLNGFYGVVQSGCLSEDNVLYDLDIPSWGKDDNTENILNDFPTYTTETKEAVEKLRTDIVNTKEAIEMYANSDKYSAEELKAAASRISLFEDYERIAAENPELGATIPQRTKTAEEIANGTFQKNKVSGGSSGGAGGTVKRAVTTTASPKSVQDVQTTSFQAAQATEYKKPEEVQKEYMDSKNKNLASESEDTFEKSATGKVSTGDGNIKVEQINKDDIIKSNTNKQVQTTNTTTGTSGTVHGGGGFSSQGYSFGGTTATVTKQEAEKVKLGAVKGIAASGQQGALASSITSTQARSLGTISKINKPINQNTSTTTDEQQEYVLPTAAALSAASVAGIGTKVYVKQAKEKDEEEREESRPDKTNQRVVLEEVVNKTQGKDEIRKQMEVEDNKKGSMDGFIIEENEL